MIKLEPNTILRSKSGKITGEIYLNFEERYFPEVGWNDFPVIILNWWSEVFSHEKSGRYSFMDGPFYFIISKASNTHYLETFYDDRPIFSTLIDIDIFKKSLINVIGALLSVIEKNDWNTGNDYELLKKNFKILKK